MNTAASALITESESFESAEAASEVVEVVEIEFDELGRFESLSMCCNFTMI
ncbi:hypothetical protein [Micromonospora sagamiensis]|uniref:Uncharacterized protein n=1 Tax=Micromonospora sagamiensis TaxID=47875 RepID=A0A562WQW1_9ACTN|nr:hypothetical protein [Micromonospora sagamiensis]TWJ32207.1 hypothetical protein JD81_05780 [Micromonospora sagamiensis]